VGHGSKIGANSVVIHDVPANSTVVGNPGHPVRVEGRRPEGPDADWVHLPDPIADAIKTLASRISALEQGGEGADGAGEGNVRPLRPSGAHEDAGEAAQRVNRSVGPNPAGG
jgi:serine O-acetyltransferase